MLAGELVMMRKGEGAHDGSSPFYGSILVYYVA